MPADVGTHLPEFVSDDVNDEVPASNEMFEFDHVD